ncbi:MAG: formate dehydrogenase subunit gamma [Burkholderiaceae bacterium]
MKAQANELQRYNDRERMNHWSTALLLLLAACSGMAFFHPSLYFLSIFTGGGPWTRILHPFIGVATALVFLGLYLRVHNDNKMTEQDKAWNGKVGEFLRGNKDAMPPAGKYNAPQKRLFWVMTLCVLVLLATGLVMWRPYFASSFPIDLVRVAVVVHAATAFVLVLSVIVHVYAAIWVKGTLRAMTRGTVSHAWARQNHGLWYREMTGDKK